MGGRTNKLIPSLLKKTNKSNSKFGTLIHNNVFMNLTAMIFFHCVRMYERIGGNLGSNFVQYLICTYDFFRNLNIFLN